MFRCSACHTELAWGSTAHQCPQCQGALDFHGGPAAFPTAALASRAGGMWRYAEALPALPRLVSLGEGCTPLVPCTIGGREVLLKWEPALPTGSYKDRGSALLISYLASYGVTEAVEDSSGNAGASLAAYAARAGIRLKVFCPASASPGKLTQIRLHGAELVPVEGPRPEATQALRRYLASSRSVYASHLWHPLFLEGIKTMAFEIAEQLHWQAPAAVVMPVGAGSILLGLAKGFGELHAAGRIGRVPALVAVQAEAVAPLYAAFQQGADTVTPAAAPRPTLAEGIALPAPVRGAALLAALRTGGGQVYAVDEPQIAAAVRAFGTAGFAVEPTSAVIWPAVERLLQACTIADEGPVVAVVSGHGLKAGAAIASLLP